VGSWFQLDSSPRNGLAAAVNFLFFKKFMFKLNYKQLLSLPKVFQIYGDRNWLREKFLVWTLPAVVRDSACLIFVVSFCFIKHRSSHFLVLYVIISFSIYYYWVRFLQLKTIEPLHGKLQSVFDLAFNIRYLYVLVAVSPYLLGFFSFICTIGIYLFYAVKSAYLVTETAASTLGTTMLEMSGELLEGPVAERAAQFVGRDMKSFKELVIFKKFGPWLEAAKNSSAGFFPISLSPLLHLQCVKNPEILALKSAGNIVGNSEALQQPLPGATAEQSWLFAVCASLVRKSVSHPNSLDQWQPTKLAVKWPLLSAPQWIPLWSAFYRSFFAKQCLALLIDKPFLLARTVRKHFSFVYTFENMGEAPFFGPFTNDLELFKVLANFSFEKFSLFQFFSFSFETAFRLWIPIFSLGYKDWLAWWIHPYTEICFMNLIGQSRYIFEPYIVAVSLVLENSIQQIYASFYMDRWFFPLCSWLTEGNPFGLHFRKLSTFILTVAGYQLKYASIYVPAEQARRAFLPRVFEILITPFIFGFKLLVWLFYDFFIYIPEVIFDPFFDPFFILW
jgi:hypothetical protein